MMPPADRSRERRDRKGPGQVGCDDAGPAPDKRRSEIDPRCQSAFVHDRFVQL